MRQTSLDEYSNIKIMRKAYKPKHGVQTVRYWFKQGIPWDKFKELFNIE